MKRRASTALALLLTLSSTSALGARESGKKKSWVDLPKVSYEVGDGVYRLPLHVTESSGVPRSAFPVTTSVPLKRGRLRHPRAIELCDEDGQPVSFQSKAQAYWPDGSIKWLMLDFPIDLKASQTRTLPPPRAAA